MKISNYYLIWYADGAFKSCLKIFYQLFIIDTVNFDVVIPVAFELHLSKSERFLEQCFANLFYMGTENSRNISSRHSFSQKIKFQSKLHTNKIILEFKIGSRIIVGESLFLKIA